MRAVVVIAALALCAAVEGSAVLRMLPQPLVDSVGARCLDGSPAGYYYHFNPESSRFIIFLEGGGYCITEKDCTARAKTAFGSSKTWSQTIPIKADGDIISTDPTINPDFYADNHIYVPYCSGDVFSGTRTAVSDETYGLYFAGHLIIDAIVQDLVARNHFADATEIIVGGISAGGIGTLNNIDFIASAFPHARVSGYLNGGWFISVEDYGQFAGSEQHSYMGDTVASAQKLFLPYVDATCATVYHPMPVYCILGPVAQPFVKSRLFIAEMIFDAEQIFIEHKTPAVENQTVAEYIGFFGEAMSTSTLYTLPIASGLKQSTGLFQASCLGHYVDWSLVVVQKQTLQQTFHNWYFNSGVAHVYDEQTQLPVNPTCVGAQFGAPFGDDRLPAEFPSRA